MEIGLLIKKTIQAQVETIVQEEARAASIRTEERVRGLVGAIVTNVLDRFSIEKIGQELVIRVELKDLDKLKK